MALQAPLLLARLKALSASCANIKERLDRFRRVSLSLRVAAAMPLSAAQILPLERRIKPLAAYLTARI